MGKMLIFLLLLVATNAHAWDSDSEAFYGKWGRSSDPYLRDPTMDRAGPYQAGERYVTTDSAGLVTSDIKIESIWNDDPDYGARVKTYDRITGERKTIRIVPAE